MPVANLDAKWYSFSGNVLKDFHLNGLIEKSFSYYYYYYYNEETFTIDFVGLCRGVVVAVFIFLFVHFFLLCLLPCIIIMK